MLPTNLFADRQSIGASGRVLPSHARRSTGELRGSTVILCATALALLIAAFAG